MDLSGAGFEFCDKFNTYALNHFRTLADWLETPDPSPTYVATIAVFDEGVRVRSLRREGIQAVAPYDFLATGAKRPRILREKIM